jgi:SAM-dependent methyltransferase
MTEFAHAHGHPGAELEAVRDAQNYYDAIFSYFAPYLGKRVVEVGAGIGSFSRLLLARALLSELTLIEPAEDLFPRLQQQFHADTRVKVINSHFERVADSLAPDSVVLVNVLEHCRDHEGLLQTIHRILPPGGTLLLFVPALPFLLGSFDKVVGHFRRYTKSSLSSVLKNAKFDIACLRYFNMPGVVTWFLAGRVLRVTSVRHSNVQKYDRWVMPWVSMLEKKWAPPIGQSLLAIARK